MAIEDFGTYTEVDPNSRVTVATRRVTHTALDRNETAYVYKDKGAAFFSGDFVQLITVFMTALSNGSVVFAWGVANTLNDFRTIKDASGNWLGISLVGTGAGVVPTIVLGENDGGSVFTDSFPGSLATPYYLKIVRDESVGSFGTLSCFIYTDAARTTLVDTLTITLHTSKKDFRYVYAVSSDNLPATPITGSGYSENLEISTSLSTALQVTTQPMTDIITTTVTGDGTIVDTGLSSVTAHGHAWNTLIDPLTSDNNVDNGAGSAGVFTSSITGLTVGQKYFVRAYATNTEGTVYGANATFIAGNIGSLLILGNISVVQTRLHYVDDDGKERYLEGILV